MGERDNNVRQLLHVIVTTQAAGPAPRLGAVEAWLNYPGK
jgi:hypothetical protein